MGRQVSARGAEEGGVCFCVVCVCMFRVCCEWGACVRMCVCVRACHMWAHVPANSQADVCQSTIATMGLPKHNCNDGSAGARQGYTANAVSVAKYAWYDTHVQS